MTSTDPRRSSRARTSQPQSQHSSTTSSTSGRAERNTRSFIKTGSPQKSTPSGGSLSSEPLEEITAEDPLAVRRRTRGSGEQERDKPHPKLESVEMPNEDDDIQEEDEAVRCICGFDDYPGPPPLEEDMRQTVKDVAEIDPIFTTDVNDDTAGFFVQCDVCKVWQHGACVGIMTEESSPDEYFCEQCRKDLHKIYVAKNGQRYSHYLPLKRRSRTTSRAGSMIKDGTKSPKEKSTRSGRNSSANHASKRRSTMNSREAGYDEADALRRAIEASKEDASVDPEDGPRAPKRPRSDSEEKPDSAKRQRTGSRSASPAAAADKSGDDSDDALSNTRRAGSRSKQPRNGATTRNHRGEQTAAEKESPDRQQQQPADPGNKRKGRSERRRADGTTASTPNSTILVRISDAHADTDSDPSDEMPLAARSAVTRTAAAAAAAAANSNSNATTNPAPAESPQATEPPPSQQQQPVPDTPPTNLAPSRADRKRSHKKKGRNQYTRDRDGNDDDSPARSLSRDIQKDDNGGGSNGSNGPTAAKSTGGDGGGGGSGKSGTKNKGGMSSKITMTDLKRRATALLDFISRTQVELAGEMTPTGSDEGGEKANGESASPAEKHPDRDEKPAQASAAPVLNGDASQGKDFKDLGCMEMMDSLTRRLVKWQQEYAT